MNMDVDRLLNLDEFPADWFAEGIVRTRRAAPNIAEILGDLIAASAWGDTRGLIGVSPPYRVED